MPYIIDSITAETINVNQELKVNGIPITPSGGGIEGSNYIYVAANGTDTENATELQTAYTTAVGLSPSATNRITIVCGPGYYNFGESAFVMDTQYIDLVSLDGNRSVLFNATLNTGNRTQGSISITANDVFVKGVDVGTKNFTIATSLNLLKVENCKGGDYSFGGDDTIGSNPITVSGTFINCTGGNGSFGGYQGTASGTFNSCIGGTYSFGSQGTASGTFTNCTGNFLSFGGGGTASGTFNSCIGGTESFGTGGLAPGTFTNCQGGNLSFGGEGTASGTFNSCIGGLNSFGGDSGTLSGKLYYCRLTSGSFKTVSGAGITRLCLDGSNVENNQG